MISIDACRKRRARLCARMSEGLAIIPTAPEKARNRDSHYPYRFDSYFYYLTAFPEPETVLVLIAGETPRSILFCRPRSEEREIWDGFRYGPEGAKEAFGFDECYPIEALDRIPDMELLRREAADHFPPLERRGHGRARICTQNIRS